LHVKAYYVPRKTGAGCVRHLEKLVIPCIFWQVTMQTAGFWRHRKHSPVWFAAQSRIRYGFFWLNAEKRDLK
jgi:hypothetical protein